MYFASLWLVEPCLGGCVRCSEHAFICVSVLRVGMASWQRAVRWSLGMALMQRPGVWMARWLAAGSVCMRGRMGSACSCMVVRKHSLGRTITVSPFLSFTRPGCISGSNRWVWTSRGTLFPSLSPPSISPASHCSVTHTQVKHTALALKPTQPKQKEVWFSGLVLHLHLHTNTNHSYDFHGTPTYIFSRKLCI